MDFSVAFAARSVPEAGLLSFALGCAAQFLLIYAQRRREINQPQKSYGIGIDVEVKASTPTGGGVVFLFSALFALALQRNEEAFLVWSLPVACGLIGFADDWLKFRNSSSEGFTSLGKLKAQLTVAFVWVLWVYLRKGLFLWSGVAGPFWLTLPLGTLAVVAVMNAVNVTDGLDGLAAGAFLISLGVLGYMLPRTGLDFRPFAALFGMTAAFLLYNARPAQIFMGDTGSHFLGGALVALCVQGGMLLALIPAGFLFGVELLSSALQIVSIRMFGRRIFKMAPLHHHFQRMGWDETTVTTRFLVIHAVGAALLAFIGTEILG